MLVRHRDVDAVPPLRNRDAVVQIFTSEPFLQLALPVTERPRGNRYDDGGLVAVDANDDSQGTPPAVPSTGPG